MRIFLLTLLVSSISFAQTSSTWNYESSKACFNTPYDDFGVRKIAGKYYIISASVDTGGVVYKDQVTGRPFTDLYELNGCKLIDAYLRNSIVGQNFLLSSPQNDGNISGDAFGKVIFFSSNYFDSLADKTGLFYMKRTTNGWSSPYFFPLNSKSYDLNHPCYDPYNKVLYFSSNMSGGKGGNDIYKIPFDGNKFGKITPVNEVNSPKNEIFPAFFDNAIYFSSDREGGVGGLDIYTLRNGVVEALPKGVNSSYDDFDFYPLGEFTSFLSSNRENQGKNDEVYFVTRTSVPLHELNLTSAMNALKEIEKNISLFAKLPMSTESIELYSNLKGLTRKLDRDIKEMASLNESLNSDIPEFLSDLVSKNIHPSQISYSDKDQYIFDLSIQFELISTTYDSTVFVEAFNRIKSIMELHFPESVSRNSDKMSALYIDGLARIKSLSLFDLNLNQSLAMNERLYFSILTEKSNSITDQQWQILAQTQAGLTEQVALLEENRKIRQLNQELMNQNRQLELLMKEFQSGINENKFNSFYTIDSLFSLFKANPTQENALKLSDALTAFNPSLLTDITAIIEKTNSNRSQLEQTRVDLNAKQSKINQGFNKDFQTFSSNIKKGETIGLKEELERLKTNYAWRPYPETDSLLNKFLFWEEDVLTKFGSLGNILFGFDSYALTTIAKSQLDSLIILYKQTPSAKLLLNGYTDNSGPYKYNLKLSKNRSASVASYLIRNGVPRKMLVKYYHGEKFPTEDNSTKEGRKLNRRVELRLEFK